MLFTEDLKQPKTAPSPISPRLGAAGKETITGVYLEGDVVMARGERVLRGGGCGSRFFCVRLPRPAEEERGLEVGIIRSSRRVGRVVEGA